MKISLSSDITSIVRDKHILLDTSVFIDSFSFPKEFKSNVFIPFKKVNATFVTIDAVTLELIKGATSISRIKERQKYVNEVVEAFLPIKQSTYESCQQLIYMYLQESNKLSITDLLLGGILAQYSPNLFLLTKNISDFPTNIFTLVSHFQLIHRRAIQNYGIYSYKR